jgi:hypothetical protein
MAGKLLGRLNKPVKEGYDYKSPNQTNAQDYTANLREDFGKSVKADNERIKKGLDAAGESPAQTESRRNSPHGNLSQKDAAGRGITRHMSRAGVLGTGLEIGSVIGKQLDKEFPELGKNIVEKSGIGPAIDKVVNMRDKAELSRSSRERLKEYGEEGMSRGPRISENESTQEMLDSFGRSGMKKGGVVRSKASKRADGIARKGFTRAK